MVKRLKSDTPTRINTLVVWSGTRESSVRSAGITRVRPSNVILEIRAKIMYLLPSQFACQKGRRKCLSEIAKKIESRDNTTNITKTKSCTLLIAVTT